MHACCAVTFSITGSDITFNNFLRDEALIRILLDAIKLHLQRATAKKNKAHFQHSFDICTINIDIGSGIDGKFL